MLKSHAYLTLTTLAASLFLAAPVFSATILSENMGTVTATTSIASNTFQNSGTYTYSGTGDVRSTTASTGYTGASGSANVFLTNSNSPTFSIGSIDTSAYAAGSLVLSFGATKSTSAATLTEMVVSYSTDGVNFTSLTFPAQGTGTAWRVITLDAASNASLPVSSTLTLRWQNTSTSYQARIDDVTLTGTAVPEPSAAVALVGGIGMLIGVRRFRSSRHS
jgi:hypothetical protein